MSEQYIQNNSFPCVELGFSKRTLKDEYELNIVGWENLQQAITTPLPFIVTT